MIVIMLLTYDRLDVAKITLESVAANLSTPEDVWMHIADDGSSQEYRDELLELAHKHYGDKVSITNSERRGYGGNYNTATQIVHQIADIVLPLEDDWKLTRLLDIVPIVEVLRAGVLDCVRMGYIGYTDELRGRLLHHGGLHWLEFDPASPEQHVFTGGPRLERVAFGRQVGPWPEGIEQGATEQAVAARAEARLKVAWPVDIIRPTGDAFIHIGTYKAGHPEAGGSEHAMQAAEA
jgi:glycosyltransferase involved in cell wall biosynthesis